MSVTLASIHELATHLRTELAEKKFILLYAYNGNPRVRVSSDPIAIALAASAWVALGRRVRSAVRR